MKPVHHQPTAPAPARSWFLPWGADSGLLSPRGMVLRAGLILAGFGLGHALGWREHTAFLSGTPTEAGTDLRISALLGVVYLAFYFGSVLAAPILLLAAVLLRG